MTNRNDYYRAYHEKHKSRIRRVNLSFNTSEITEFEVSAKASGVPLTTYVKSCAMQGHIGQRNAPEEVVNELADLSRMVRNIANNVNQMARHSNRIGQVLDENEVFAQIHDLEKLLKVSIVRSATGGTQAPPEDDDT